MNAIEAQSVHRAEQFTPQRPAERPLSDSRASSIRQIGENIVNSRIGKAGLALAVLGATLINPGEARAESAKTPTTGDPDKTRFVPDAGRSPFRQDSSETKAAASPDDPELGGSATPRFEANAVSTAGAPIGNTENAAQIPFPAAPTPPNTPRPESNPKREYPDTSSMSIYPKLGRQPFPGFQEAVERTRPALREMHEIILASGDPTLQNYARRWWSFNNVQTSDRTRLRTTLYAPEDRGAQVIFPIFSGTGTLDAQPNQVVNFHAIDDQLFNELGPKHLSSLIGMIYSSAFNEAKIPVEDKLMKQDGLSAYDTSIKIQQGYDSENITVTANLKVFGGLISLADQADELGLRSNDTADRYINAARTIMAAPEADRQDMTKRFVKDFFK